MYVVFLAYRYLRSLWLTYLAVGMVCVGVLAMVVVLSVMWGLEDFSRRTLRGTLSDVEVFRPRGMPIEGYDALCASVREVPGVRGAWPVVEGAAVLRDGGFSRGIQLQGLDLEDPEASRELRRFVEDAHRKSPGESPPWVPSPDGTSPAPLYLGYHIDGLCGDEVDLFVAANSPAYSPTPTMPSVNRIPALIAGRFLSRSYFDDEWRVYLPLARAQRLFRFNHPPTVNRLHVRLQEGEDDVAAAGRILGKLGEGFHARPWTRLAEQQVAMLRVENQIIAIIMAFMLVLAGFGILAVLNMQVTHKLVEIGILKALGGTRLGIAGIFLISSTAIGILGAALALALGLPFLHYLNPLHAWIGTVTGGWQFYMVEAYGTDGIPVLIRPGAIAAIALGAVAVSALAGVWPAWRATRLQPAEALRNG